MVLDRAKPHDDDLETGSLSGDSSDSVTIFTENPPKPPKSAAQLRQEHVNGRHSDEGDSWETAARNKRKKGNTALLGYGSSDGSPAFTHSLTARLEKQVNLSDLQSVILYVLGDGPAPNWIAISQAHKIDNFVVLLVPGLELAMFEGQDALDVLALQDARTNAASTMSDPVEAKKFKALSASPDGYYPQPLLPNKLAPSLRPLASIFSHVWPVKAPGDSNRAHIYSPVQAMLLSPLKRREYFVQRSGQAKADRAKSVKTSIVAFLADLDDMNQNGFIVHPAVFLSNTVRNGYAKNHRTHLKTTAADGWVDSDVDESIAISSSETDFTMIEGGDQDPAEGYNVYAIDCEMCQTSEFAHELARVTVLDWNDTVVMDELVKPGATITNYLTAYSGITKDMLDPVTTTIEGVQAKLLKLLTPNTIIVGHSLESDLAALKLTHPNIIDTALIYPHHQGPPMKSSLKYLAKDFLSQEIQGGGKGHNSVEDARTALHLVKLKCERGPKFGIPVATMENIFKRLSRKLKNKSGSRLLNGAIVDRCNQVDTFGRAAQYNVICRDDADVVVGISKATNRMSSRSERGLPVPSLIWGQLHDLREFRGWDHKSTEPQESSDPSKEKPEAVTESFDAESDNKETKTAFSAAVTRVVNHINEIHGSLAPHTGFIVYSGVGNAMELKRLQKLKKQHKLEYATMRWDELTVPWLNADERDMKDACDVARQGIAFLMVTSQSAL